METATVCNGTVAAPNCVTVSASYLQVVRNLYSPVFQVREEACVFELTHFLILLAAAPMLRPKPIQYGQPLPRRQMVSW
jgi:hypothetical protein